MKTTIYLLSLCLLISLNGFSQNNDQIEQALDSYMSMMAATSNVEVEDAYHFDNAVDIELSTFTSKKTTSEMSMRMLFPANASYYAMEIIEIKGTQQDVPESITVFDYSSFKVISLMNMSGQKMGFAMDLKESQIEEWKAVEEDRDEKTEFVKTGKTKEILGYTCDQYLISNGDGDGEFWISNDADLQIGLALNAMSQNAKGKSYEMPKDYPEGAILEMNYADKNGEGMNWIAIAVNKNIKRSISTSEYSFMSFGQ
jgi:hypothetical protein